MKTPTLQTERLILRPLSLADVPAIQTYFNDWDIVRWTSAPWPYPPEDTEPHIKKALLKTMQGDEMHWVIIFRDTKEFIGCIDYRDLKTDLPDRGFWIAKPFWGQGYMSEAVHVSQNFMFSHMDLERIASNNFKDNAASRRVQEKAGLEYKGDAAEIVRGEEMVFEIWEITKAQWLSTMKNKA